MKIGDLVQLKSGGPVMTVDYIKRDEEEPDASEVSCVWFESKSPRNMEFCLGSLKKVKESA
jgi:uncharacterized protein YodC (DUF2158 family)